MWGNLADRLGAADALQKVAEAVAPPADFDEYYDDDEDGEDYDDDDGSYEEEGAPTFGLVGMLGKLGAVDPSHGEGEDENDEYDMQGHHQDGSTPSSTGGIPVIQGLNSMLQSGTAADSQGVQEPSTAIAGVNGGSDNHVDDNGPSLAAKRRQARAEKKKELEAEQQRIRDKQQRAKELAQQELEFLQDDENNGLLPASSSTDPRPAPEDIEFKRQEQQKQQRLAEQQQQKRQEQNEKKRLIEQRRKQDQQRQREKDEARQQAQRKLAQEEQQQQQAAIARQKELAAAQEEEDRQREEQKRARLKQEEETLRKRKMAEVAEVASREKREALDRKQAAEAEAAKEKATLERQERLAAEEKERQQKERQMMENEAKQRHKNTVAKTEEAEQLNRQVGGTQPGGATTTNQVGQQDDSEVVRQYQTRCKKLEAHLKKAQATISTMQEQSSSDKEQSQERIDKMMADFQAKEARLLEASNDESQHEMLRLEQRLQSEIHSLEERLAMDRKGFVQQQEQSNQALENSERRADQAEDKLRKVLKNQETQLLQVEQQGNMNVDVAEEKLASTLARLDDRNEEIKGLKELIKSLESSVNEHADGADEAEEEVEALESENETLRANWERSKTECSKLKTQIKDLEADSEELGAIQMELTMLREERDREKAKSQSAVESAFTSHSQIETERDIALAENKDLHQQLEASRADLEVVAADKERIVQANNNLQMALESFQDERQAEMGLVEEQQQEAVDSVKAAHEASIQAIRQTHEADMHKIQGAADSAVKNVMDQMADAEVNLSKLKSENVQMRRSLDEAIHRLQTTQEDVIDRTLMKNVLLDWCTMKDKQKRHDVLQLMANVLHFTEDEKEKVHLTHLDIESVRSRVVGAIAAPLPASKADIEHLEGKNVADKWVNFLLAETDDGDS